MDEAVVYQKLEDLGLAVATLNTKMEDIQAHVNEDRQCRIDIKKDLGSLKEMVAVIKSTCVLREDLNGIKSKIQEHDTYFKFISAVLIIVAGVLTGVAGHFLP